MKSVKTNYVIGCWSGPRQEYPSGAIFIRTHLEQLQRVKHQLDLVTIGYPRCEQENPEYTDYMMELEHKGCLEDGTPVDVLRTDNVGLSYGQWYKAYEKYTEQFDYYILIEDDYLPVIDHFDSELIEMQRKLSSGYLCGLIFDQSGRYGAYYNKHAAMSNGIITSDCFKAIYEKHGSLLFQNNAEAQIAFTRLPLTVGHRLDEYISDGKFRSLFWDHEKILIYGKSESAQDIFVPIQHMDGKTYVYKFMSEYIC